MREYYDDVGTMHNIPLLFYIFSRSSFVLYFILYFFCVLYISKNGKRTLCVCVCEWVCWCSYLFVYWLVSCLAEVVLLHDHYEFSHLFDGEYFNGACVSTVHVLISFCCCNNTFVVQHFSLAFVLSLDFNLVYRCFFNPFLPAMATTHSI